VFRELTAAQSREFVDAAQTFEALMSTEQRRAGYAGGMHWKSVNGSEYLYRTTGGRGRARSLGRRSEKTEAVYAEFHRGKGEVDQRYKTQLAALTERARFCRAARINRVPRVVTAILRELELRGLLGSGLSVVGTNALYAYEAAAACQFDSSLLATADMDLLWDARSKLQLSGGGDRMAGGLIDVLRKADSSFEPIKKDSFRAANKDGYLVDLIKPTPRPPWIDQPKKLVASDELVAAEIANLEWLQSSPRFSHVVIGDDGMPATMVTPDPRAFAVYKLWLSKQSRREALKRGRDQLQALAVARLVAERLPNLPFDAQDLKAFPQDVIDAARRDLPETEWVDDNSQAQ
jgi:hypothetical protein